MGKSFKIMGHLVIGYPDLDQSYQTAKTYIKNGIQILELQIPFSNPTADGTIITIANKIAIQNKVFWKDCLDFLHRLRSEFPDQTVYLMTYMNKLLSLDLHTLSYRLNKLKITGLIIPDLPFDSTEYLEIENFHQIDLVPVIGVNITKNRLNELLSNNPKFIYLMSGFKITGSIFDLHKENQLLIRQIKEQSSAKIGIGFGVNSYQDALAISEIADIVIVGSALLKAQKQGKLKEKILQIQGKI